MFGGRERPGVIWGRQLENVWFFLHDEGAEVLGVEHHDVGHASDGVEAHERRHEDLERESQVVRKHGTRVHVLVVARLGVLHFEMSTV
jgi:hypothetical protein